MSDQVVRYRVNTVLTASKVYDDEAIVINTATGRYYDLEGSGADIWALLPSGVTVSEVARALAVAYEVEAEAVKGDVGEFLDRLQQEQLVVIDGGGTEEPVATRQSSEQRRTYIPPKVTTFTDMEELLAADPPMPAAYTPVWQAPPDGS